MGKSSQQKNVEIHVHGDVTNSTIIGIDGRTPIRTDDSLFRKVLFEYIGIPTLREVASRVELFAATNRGIVREFDFARSSALLQLWMAVLQDRYGFASPGTFMLDAYDDNTRSIRKDYSPSEREDPIHPGTWVKLRNVHLSSFVNRAPGKFFLGGWRFGNGHEPNTKDRFAVSQSMWTWEDYAVRTIGIGDVRFGELEGYVILQAGCASGVNTSPTDAGGATLSPLGFPVLVEHLAYQRLKPLFDDYGSALIDELTAQLLPAPKESGLIWAPGIPKTCLVVTDRANVSGVSTPRRSHNAIWTVAANNDSSKFHYCVWGFTLGEKGYRESMRAAAQTIVAAMHRRNLHAIFECDAEQNWFSENAAFGPTQIDVLAKQVSKQERLKAELAITDIDAGADHMIADCDGAALDMQSMDSLSRAWRLFQLDETQQSLAMTDDFLEEHPMYPFARYLRGLNLMCLGHQEAAREELQLLLAESGSYRLKDRIEYALDFINKRGQ